MAGGWRDAEHPDDFCALGKFVGAASVEERSIQRQGLLNNFQEHSDNLI